jgi:FAD/FMN-containing dehydrogenase
MAETMTAVQPKAARVDRAAIEQAQALLAALRPRLAGEARFDGWTRMLYSTDASLYQVMPVGVVLPRTDEDVHATLQVARDFGVPIVPRGGGSSLEGQTVGTGIVIDFSKYMNRVLEVDEEAQTARVQPGMVLDPFNREMQRYGLMYGPDPASSNRATFGGMIGNNSTGAHSILYGMSHDNVQALRDRHGRTHPRRVGPKAAPAHPRGRGLPPDQAPGRPAPRRNRRPLPAPLALRERLRP